MSGTKVVTAHSLVPQVRFFYGERLLTQDDTDIHNHRGLHFWTTCLHPPNPDHHCGQSQNA